MHPKGKKFYTYINSNCVFTCPHTKNPQLDSNDTLDSNMRMSMWIRTRAYLHHSSTRYTIISESRWILPQELLIYTTFCEMRLLPLALYLYETDSRRRESHRKQMHVISSSLLEWNHAAITWWVYRCRGVQSLNAGELASECSEYPELTAPFAHSLLSAVATRGLVCLR
jgi:hypothetical protein